VTKSLGFRFYYSSAISYVNPILHGGGGVYMYIHMMKSIKLAYENKICRSSFIITWCFYFTD